jgi:hypothetical protein
MFTEYHWERLKKIYTEKYKEILQNINLQAHLQDVEASIIELDEVINRERLNGPTPRLDEIKNDYYFLKYEILERL